MIKKEEEEKLNKNKNGKKEEKCVNDMKLCGKISVTRKLCEKSTKRQII